MAGGCGSIWQVWRVRALRLSRQRVAGFCLILLLLAAIFVGYGATGPLLALKIAVYLACASLLFAAFLARTAADVRADTWPHVKWLRYTVYGGQLLVSLVVLYFVPLSFMFPVLATSPFNEIAAGVALVGFAPALLFGAIVTLLVAGCLVVLVAWMPVVITRGILRQRRRRQYRFPAR